MTSKYDWDILRKEYITGKRKLCELSAKYNIPYSTIKNHAHKNKWSLEKGGYLNAGLNNTAKALELAEGLANIVKKALKDECQFNRHIVKSRDSTDEMIFNKIDMRAVSEAVKALKTIEGIKRSINEVIRNNTEKKSTDENREDAQGETGVIEIARVDTSDVKQYGE